MEKQRQIVVLGNSLLMDSVATNLQQGLAQDVIRMNIDDCLESLNPELIILELDLSRPQTVLSFLLEKAGATFLGIDLENSQVIVFDSQRYPIRNVDEFCELVKSKLDRVVFTQKEVVTLTD